MAIIQIPVRNDTPAFRFQMTLQDRIYTFNFRYNSRSGIWSMDIADQIEDPIFSGIPLLTEVLLLNGLVSPRRPLGDFVVIDESGKHLDPSRETLGKDVKLVYIEG